MRPVLVVGDGGFERFSNHLAARGIPAVLAGYAHSAIAPSALHVDLAVEEVSVQHIARLAREWNVRGVICRPAAHNEAAVVRDALVKELLEREGIPVVAQPVLAAVICVDKGHMRHFLASRGVRLAPGYVVAGLRDVLEVGERMSYPCVMKNPILAATTGVRFVRAPEDLEPAYAALACHRVILEEFLQGIEIGIDVFGHEGRYVVYPPVKGRLTTFEADPRGTVRTSPWAGETEVVARVEEAALEVAQMIGSDGPLNFDFVVRDGEPHLLEVNGRIGGIAMLGLAATGIDPYELVVQMVLGEWDAQPVAPQRIGVEIPFHRDNAEVVQRAAGEAYLNRRRDFPSPTREIVTLSLATPAEGVAFLSRLPAGSLDPAVSEDLHALFAASS